MRVLRLAHQDAVVLTQDAERQDADLTAHYTSPSAFNSLLR